MTPELGPPIEIRQPAADTVPLVVSSPHSGRIYPPSLLRAARLDLEQLRALEDGWVDRLFAGAPALGAPLLCARFARAYVDPNREAFELDAELLEGPLPGHANPGSVKARAGLGSVPSRIGGRAIYRSRLAFAEVERRLERAYWPYHQALEGLIGRAHAEFGAVLLLDCHSMPSLASNGCASRRDAIDFALGDRFGRSCATPVIDLLETLLRARGFRVARNRPYAGGHITARYGQPEVGVHALQLEVRRGLFMDERTRRPHEALAEIAALMQELLIELAECARVELVPRRPALPLAARCAPAS